MNESLQSKKTKTIVIEIGYPKISIIRHFNFLAIYLMVASFHEVTLFSLIVEGSWMKATFNQTLPYRMTVVFFYLVFFFLHSTSICEGFRIGQKSAIQRAIEPGNVALQTQKAL